MKIPNKVKVVRENVDRNYPIAFRESKPLGGEEPNKPKEFYKYTILKPKLHSSK